MMTAKKGSNDRKMSSENIRLLDKENLVRYAQIYAEAFSCEPWNDHWKIEDAKVHIKELLGSKQAYGLEYVIDGHIVGFILGTSMLFSYGRTFEINDLAVDPQYHRQGIAKKLLHTLLSELKSQNIKGVHLITSNDGFLQKFYEQFDFKKETRVVLMGAELK